MYVNINVSVTSFPYSFCLLLSTHIVPIARLVINSRPHDTRVGSLTNAHLVLPSHPCFLPLPTSQGEFNSCLPDCPSKLTYVGLMRPRNQALFHPAIVNLLSYATNGCLVDCGKDWTIRQMQTAIESAQHPIAAKACRQEALAQAAEGGCQIIQWKTLRESPPPNLKISPIAAIPHKSRLYRMILDLSFELQVNKEKLCSVNDSSDKALAPHHAMYKLGNIIS